MPRSNCKRHHQQLGENECSEGNGHNVDEFLIEQKNAAEHNDATYRENKARSSGALQEE